MQLFNIIQREETKFIIIGILAVTIDFVAYNLLILSIESIDTSKMMSFVMGAIFGFFLNKFWTFKKKPLRFIEILLYIGLYTLSGTLNTFSNYLFYSYILNLKIFAFLFATSISTVINFLGQKYIVFNLKGE
jgi:putative flippase GtrA